MMEPYAFLSLEDEDGQFVTSDVVRKASGPRIDLSRPEHIIGRNAPTDPQPRHLGWTTLDLAWVSGRHCLFKLLEADPASGKELVVTLTDTSSNGTFVNGNQLRKNVPTTLDDGDKIHVFKPRRAASKEQLVFYTFRFDPRGRTAETVQARLSSYDGSTKSGHGAQVATINALQTSAHHAATATGANSGAGPEAGGESMGHEAVQKQMAKVQRANAALRQELEEQRAEVDSLASQLRKADDHAKKAAAAARAELAQATAKIASEVEVAREAQRAAEAALEASQQECAKWKADCAAAEAAKSAEAARGEDKVRQLRCAEGELEAREARVKDLAAMLTQRKKEAAAQQASLEAATAEGHAFSQKLAAADDSLATHQAEIESLRKAATTHATSLSEAEAAVEAAQAKATAALARENAAIENLAELEGAAESLAAKDAELKRAKDHAAALEADLEKERSTRDAALARAVAAEANVTVAEQAATRAAGGATALAAAEATAAAAIAAQKTAEAAAEAAQEQAHARAFDADKAKRAQAATAASLDASNERAEALDLRLAQAKAALGRLMALEQTRRVQWDAKTSDLHFQLVALDQQESQQSPMLHSPFTSPRLSQDARQSPTGRRAAHSANLLTVSSQAEEGDNGVANGSGPTTQEPDWAGTESTQADGNTDGIADGSPCRKRPGNSSALDGIDESSTSPAGSKRLRGEMSGEEEEGKGTESNEDNETDENALRGEGGTPGKSLPAEMATAWDEDATQATDSAFKPKARQDNDAEEEDFGATQMDGAFGGTEANDKPDDGDGEDKETDDGEKEEKAEAEEETNRKQPAAEDTEHMQDDDDAVDDEEGGAKIEDKDEDEDEEKLHTQPGSRSGSQRSTGSPSLKLDNSTAESPSNHQSATLERGYTVGGAQGEESFASHGEDGS